MVSRISGEGGEVQLVSRVAATVGKWTIDGGVLTAKVESSDSFKLSQSSLAFVVKHRGWRWTLTSVQVAGNRLTAHVGERTCDL